MVCEDVVGLVVLFVFNEACEAVFVHAVYKYGMSFAWFHVSYVDAFGCLAGMIKFFYLAVYP